MSIPGIGNTGGAGPVYSPFNIPDEPTCKFTVNMLQGLKDAFSIFFEKGDSGRAPNDFDLMAIARMLGGILNNNLMTPANKAGFDYMLRNSNIPKIYGDSTSADSLYSICGQICALSGSGSVADSKELEHWVGQLKLHLHELIDDPQNSLKQAFEHLKCDYAYSREATYWSAIADKMGLVWKLLHSYLTSTHKTDDALRTLMSAVNDAKQLFNNTSWIDGPEYAMLEMLDTPITITLDQSPANVTLAAIASQYLSGAHSKDYADLYLNLIPVEGMSQYDDDNVMSNFIWNILNFHK